MGGGGVRVWVKRWSEGVGGGGVRVWVEVEGGCG